jgi:hypothetical protein
VPRGAPARRWQAKTPGKNLHACSRTSVTTLLVGDREMVAVSLWRPGRKTAAALDAIPGVGESLTGLVREAPAVPPAAEPAGR